MMEAIIFCGLQGAGKSTFYRHRFLHTHVRINLDMLKTRNREDILLYACLAAQQPIVVDNTNPTVKSRNRYAMLARAAGFRVGIYYFVASVEEALARNLQRPEPERVPDLAILGGAAKFEAPTRSESAEDFYVVKIGPDQTFIVEELP